MQPPADPGHRTHAQVDVKIKLQAKGDPSERKTREQVAAALPPKATLDRFRAVVARAKAGSLTVPLDVSEVRCDITINGLRGRCQD